MAALAVPGGNARRVALSENGLISQLRIYQAKFLLQLFNDMGETLVDDLSVGLSEFYAANAPIRIAILLRLLVMNDHSDEAAAFRRIFSNRLGDRQLELCRRNLRSPVLAPPRFFGRLWRLQLDRCRAGLSGSFGRAGFGKRARLGGGRSSLENGAGLGKGCES